MYPAKFDYVRPSTIEEAVALLAKHGDGAKLLAGGHSLIPAMKLRLARPEVVLDVARLATLTGIGENNGIISIGAATTHRQVVESPLLRQKCPLLPESAAHIGDVQVRNKGTIGGSLAHADPAADYPAAILALEAEIRVAGPNGIRTIRAADFFVDLFQTALAPGEIITDVCVPATAGAVAYVKTEQKASGFALAGAAVVIGASGVRVGITGVAPKAYRASAVERALGPSTPLTAQTIALASAHAADGVEALSDIHASAEYRRHLAEVNTRRALERALSRR